MENTSPISESQNVFAKPTHKTKKVIKLIIISCVILFVFNFLIPIKLIYVYDLETKKPVEGVQVVVAYPTFDGGCIDYGTLHKTNSSGVVIEFGSIFERACAMEAEKEGYILNGQSEPFDLPLFYKISLQEEKYESQLHHTQDIHEGDGADILSYVTKPIPVEEEPNPASSVKYYYQPIKAIQPRFLSENTPDIIINKVTKGTYNQLTVKQFYDVTLTFLGEGGIQKINNLDTKEVADYSGLPYSFYNLTQPPKDGYQKEITISGQDFEDGNDIYVAKLRDGKTFIKFLANAGQDHDGEYVTGMLIATFNEYIPKVLSNVDVLTTNKREINVYPPSKVISYNEDFYIEGKGFSPGYSLDFLLEETGTIFKAVTEPNGTWRTYFGDSRHTGGYRVAPTTSAFRTVSIVGSDGYKNKIVFTIDKSSPTRTIYFAGLQFDLPTEYVVLGHDLKDSYESTGFYNKSQNSRLLFHSYAQSYEDYLIGLRSKHMVAENIFPGVSEISPHAYPYEYQGENITEYTFYDSAQRRSYFFREDVDSKLNWGIKDFLDLIQNEQIQI